MSMRKDFVTEIEVNSMKPFYRQGKVLATGCAMYSFSCNMGNNNLFHRF